MKRKESKWLTRLPGALKELRVARGLTQAAAAERTRELTASRLTSSGLAQWEAGMGAPSTRSLFAFLEALGASPHELAGALTGTREEPTPRNGVAVSGDDHLGTRCAPIKSPGALAGELTAQQLQIQRLEAELSEVRSHLGLTDRRLGLFGFKQEKH